MPAAFGTDCTSGPYDVQADIDRNCEIDGEDLAILASQFGATRPGDGDSPAPNERSRTLRYARVLLLA
jgi:hypothetical protein